LIAIWSIPFPMSDAILMLATKTAMTFGAAAGMAAAFGPCSSPAFTVDLGRRTPDVLRGLRRRLEQIPVGEAPLLSSLQHDDPGLVGVDGSVPS
jgi:hypothetical protein